MELEQDLVSIIMPVYNGKSHIEQAVASVFQQTYQKWELIVIDDCSTDGTYELLMKNYENDNRLCLLRNETNQGIAKSRNKGISHGKGQFIAFLDSDDMWDPKKLEEQIAFMKNHQVAFSYTDCRVIDVTGQWTGKNRIAPKEVTYQQLLYGNPIPCLTVVLDRLQVPKIEMPLVKHEDYLAWLYLLQTIPKAENVGNILASYRVSSDSVSAKKWKAALWQWNIYRKELKLGFWESLKYELSYLYQAVKKRV